MAPPPSKRRHETPHGEPSERILKDKELPIAAKCWRCGRAKSHHQAPTLECPMGKRTRGGYTEFAAERFMGSDEIRALAQELQEKAETETNAAAALALLRDANLLKSLADLKERKPGTPDEDDL